MKQKLQFLLNFWQKIERLLPNLPKFFRYFLLIDSRSTDHPKINPGGLSEEMRQYVPLVIFPSKPHVRQFTEYGRVY